MYLKTSAHTAGISLEDVSSFLGAELHGDPKILCFGLCPITRPVAGKLCFTTRPKLDKIEDELSAVELDGSLAGILAPQGSSIPKQTQQNYLLVDDPQRALITVTEKFFTKYKPTPGIAKSATIDPSAEIATDVHIAANVVIGANVKIASGCILMPNVSIYHDTTIGKDCLLHTNVTIREACTIGNKIIIQSGSIIGSDGFGYLPDPTVGIMTVPQVGNVILEDAVHVGANTCIDRGALGSTKIGMGTKIDNNVQIGHNVQTGNFCIFCGHVAIAGSTNFGNQVTLGGGVKVQGHLTIADQVRVGGDSTIRRNVMESGDYAGDPLMPIKEWRRYYLNLQKKI